MCICCKEQHAFVVVSNSKDPKYVVVEAVCLNEDEAAQSLKRYNLEAGANAISSLYEVPFFNINACHRFRDSFSKIDNGEDLCYVVSKVVGDEKIPVCVVPTVDEAEEKGKDFESVYDCVHIKVS
jgi:hypothetical protein